jgi:hypothetical protein
MPFVSSPDLEKLARYMSGVSVQRDLIAAAQATVDRTHMVEELRRSAYMAGCSPQMSEAIDTFIDGGQVWVGVPKSAEGREARDLEYGTAQDRPYAWLRTTIARNQKAYQDEFSAQLTHHFFGIRP